MRTVETKAPSFPIVPPNQLLPIPDKIRWQVLCGDTNHWRAGIYSPQESKRADIKELEQHDCPELFLLLSGHLVLVISNQGEIQEIELEKEKPILITAPHCGYCPQGPYTGKAFVIERDAFSTEYNGI